MTHVPTVYEGGRYLPVVDVLSRTRARSARTGARTVFQSSPFDMYTGTDPAKLIQLGQDM